MIWAFGGRRRLLFFQGPRLFCDFNDDGSLKKRCGRVAVSTGFLGTGLR